MRLNRFTLKGGGGYSPAGGLPNPGNCGGTDPLHSHHYYPHPPSPHRLLLLPQEGGLRQRSYSSMPSQEDFQFIALPWQAFYQVFFNYECSTVSIRALEVIFYTDKTHNWPF